MKSDKLKRGSALKAVKEHDDRLLSRHLSRGASPGLKDVNGNSLLHHAAAVGHEEGVRVLLQACANVDVKNRAGYSPLYVAVERGHLLAARALVEAGADTAARVGHDRCSALDLAVVRGHIDILSMLTGHGADVNAADARGATPLHLATYINRTAAIEALVAAGARIGAAEWNEGWTPLHIAAKQSQLEATRTLLRLGAMVSVKDKAGRTPLYLVNDAGSRARSALAVARALLNAGAKVFESPSASAAFRGFPRVLLHSAIVGRDKDLLHMLIERGVEVNRDPDTRLDPVSVAAKHDNTPAISLLVEAGASVSSRNETGQTPLHFAAKSGSTGATATLIRRGARVNALDDAARTPLHIAADMGHAWVVGILLAADAHVNASDKFHNTPIHAAAVRDSAATIEALLAAGANTGARGHQGRTAIHFASLTGALDAAGVLLRHKVDLSKLDDAGLSPLHLAVVEQRFYVAERLLRAGAVPSPPPPASGFFAYSSILAVMALPDDCLLVVAYLVRQCEALVECIRYGQVNVLHNASKANKRKAVDVLIDAGVPVDSQVRASGWTPLHFAAKGGAAEVAAALIRHGADVNKAAKGRVSPLHVAAEHGSRKVARILLEAHADPTMRCEGDHRSALDLASSYGHTGVIDELLGKNVDVNQRGFKGDSALHAAAAAGTPEATEALLLRGADVNAAKSNGQTALHLAAKASGSSSVVIALLRHGADKDSKSRLGTTPLHLAAEGGHINNVNTLLEAGASLDANLSGETALHLAASQGHVNVVEALIRHGVDVEAPSTFGQTALHLAAEDPDSPSVVKALLRHGADKDRLDNAGDAPLHLAVRAGHVSHVRALLDVRANPNAVCGMHEETTLHLAVRHGHLHVLRALIRHGVDLEAATTDDITALYLATICDNCQAVDMLASAGAATTAARMDGQTALHSVSCPRVALVLMKYMDVNTQDDHGWSPLHCAARNAGRENTARLVDTLLRGGADETIRDQQGDVALAKVGRASNLGTTLGDRLIGEDGPRTPSAVREIFAAMMLDGSMDHPDLERVILLLKNAPADRAWRRRGFFLMCCARRSRGEISTSPRGKVVKKAAMAVDEKGKSESLVTVDVKTSGRRGHDHKTGWVAWNYAVSRMLDLEEDGLFRLIVSFL